MAMRRHVLLGNCALEAVENAVQAMRAGGQALSGRSMKGRDAEAVALAIIRSGVARGLISRCFCLTALSVRVVADLGRATKRETRGRRVVRGHLYGGAASMPSITVTQHGAAVCTMSAAHVAAIAEVGADASH